MFQFAVSGSVLQEMFPNKLEELLIRVRARLAAGGFKRESTTYWLLLALDLANKNWEVFPEPLAMFYASRLGKQHVSQLQSANVDLLPAAPRGNHEQRRSGRNKEYWQHDDRTSDVGKEDKVPQGRPLHGTGRSANKGNKDKESLSPQDENWV
jgi:hypothetical protein